ncbi:MAG: NAD(P)-dependent alcohol dehydrogenase [Christensenellales bacterium]|jgi:L-iditol 2-dehydrogenase
MKNRAFMLTSNQKLEMQEIPMPAVGDDDVLVNIKAVGICGSDVHYYAKGRVGDFVVEYPFLLGHEAAGVVAQVGKNVKNFRVGDRVTMEPGIPCGHCEMCLTGKYNLCPDVIFWATPPYDGCLCDYVSHPAAFTFRLPENVSFEEGALIEPLAIGVNAAKTGDVRLGDTVVIFGAGCIGLVSLLAAKAYGASRVIICDVLEKRLETAKKLGGEIVNSAKCDAVETIMQMTDGKGASTVIDCCGISKTVQQSLRVASAAAKVVLVGLGEDEINGLPLGMLSTKELEVHSIFRYRNLYPTTIAAVADGKIDISGIVSNVYPFEKTDVAYKEAYENAKDVVKGVIVY